MTTSTRLRIRAFRRFLVERFLDGLALAVPVFVVAGLIVAAFTFWLHVAEFLDVLDLAIIQ